MSVDIASRPGAAEAATAPAALPVIPLSQRIEGLRACAGEEQPVPLPEPGEEPVPMPEPVHDPVRAWALQIFKEKLFYGEEEENGVPSLSIEL